MNLTLIEPMNDDALQKVRDLEALTQQLPQTEIPTDHVLHAGMYARTILIPAGTILTGALIELPTILIIQGDADVFTGEDTHRLTGYHVIAAQAGRKQAFVTHADTHVTMIFTTEAEHIAQAEDEFTKEADRLLSRRQLSCNTTHRSTTCPEQSLPLPSPQ